MRLFSLLCAISHLFIVVLIIFAGLEPSKFAYTLVYLIATIYFLEKAIADDAK